MNYRLTLDKRLVYTASNPQHALTIAGHLNRSVEYSFTTNENQVLISGSVTGDLLPVINHFRVMSLGMETILRDINERKAA